MTLRDELDAADALALVGLEDKDIARTALRISLKIQPADGETFDRLLGVFWHGETAAPRTMPRPPRDLPKPGRLLHWDPETARMGGTHQKGDQPGYSPEAVLRRKAFDTSWSARDIVTMERLLARLAQRLATKKSRRLVPTAGRGQADVRASYRRALRTSGELLTLARRTKAIEEPRVTFLIDTSGSMDTHTRFLLTFVLALRRAVPQVEAFAFNTSLVRITPEIARAKGALERIANAVPDWSGGTRIGECLATFARDHLKGDHAVVVVSDGLDRGDPARLVEAVQSIRRRARRLVWLNPLAGDPRYEPSAAGMRAALPYVDHFASAHDLASLERVLPQLVA